jgi:hypothetical protein
MTSDYVHFYHAILHNHLCYNSSFLIHNLYLLADNITPNESSANEANHHSNNPYYFHNSIDNCLATPSITAKVEQLRFN